MLNGGADGDKNGGTIGNVIGNGLRNGYLLLCVREFPLLKGRVDHARGTTCAPMMAANQPLLAQFADIAPDRLCRHFQQLRQLVDVHIAALGDQLDQLIVAWVAGKFSQTHAPLP
ncbi:hypothetical protein D3C78_1523050 [compost metagenome]